jgi:hypothetical protein
MKKKSKTLIVGLSSAVILLQVVGMVRDGDYPIHGLVIFFSALTIYFSIADSPKKPN